MKSIIGQSYNKLYGQFMSQELTEVGNYKILKQIGEGSFGKVYLACHKPTHRKVVLKTSDKNDPNVVREVFYHRQFDYLYITKLYEVIVTETKVWMALEYCSGKELYEHLLAMKRIPLDESAKLFAQIAGAVYYAHSLNCVHRDLKLENILLDKKGNAKLADFGFTRECVSKSSLETICGTTVYMAPELTQRKNYDGFKIDIWSLGVILYTMINGSMPFDEDLETKTKWKIVNEMPEFNEEIMDESSIDLISQLMAKDPNERPSMQKILSHPFLEPHGTFVLEKTNKILSKQRRGLNKFHSRTERKLLKRLKQSGFDTQAIKASIQKKRCDSLSALWLLLVEREKASEKNEKLNYPRRSRSVLSVRKVLDAASITDGRLIEEGFLAQQLDCRIATPLSKIMSRKSDSVSIVASSPLKKQVGPNVLQEIDSSVINKINSNPASNSSTPRKNNIFTKMTKFFKNKKNNNDNSHFDNRKQRTSEESQKSRMNIAKSPGVYEKKRANRSDSSKSISRSFNQLVPRDHDMDPEGDIHGENSKSVQIIDGPGRQARKLKRFKSTTSSDISRQTSMGNYDSESTTNNARPSDENLKLSLSSRARPFSGVSQHSEISNETFNSEYSTDGNVSSFRIADSNRASLPQMYTGNVIQDTVSNDKVFFGNKQRIARRDLSIMSSASSASEKSSRTDSFYDITTASSPSMMDVRNTKRTSIKDSVLPRFGKQTSWKSKRNPNPNPNRRSILNRRAHGRTQIGRQSSHQQSIIQEESSSGDDPERRVCNDILQTTDSLEEADELAVHSDSDARCMSVLDPSLTPNSKNRTSIICARSLSEGSDISQNYARLPGELIAGSVSGEEAGLLQVESHGKGHEDEFTKHVGEPK